MKKILFLLFLLSGLIVACNSNTDKKEANNEQASEQEVEEAAWKEVMRVHDEVMPKMADMNRVSRSLKPYLEEGALEDKSPQEKVNRAVKELEAADEAMMDWMGAIKQLPELRKEMDHDAIMAYLEKEQEAIAKVKEDMLSSLQSGKTLLEKLENDEQ